MTKRAWILLFAMLVARPSSAGGHEYRVGEVVTYHNPYDGTPERKGRVTKIDEQGNLWVDFKEFDPSLNIAEASKIIFKGTNQFDDWTHPSGSGVPANKTTSPPGAPAERPMTTTGNPPQGAAEPAKAPAGVESFLGKWSTLYVGHPIGYAPGDGYVYIQQERAAQGGLITINRDGTFVWNATQGPVRGTWRPATQDELLGQFPGGGIRMLKGENGWDYTITHRQRVSNNVPDSIAIVANGYEVIGWRVR